MVYNKTMNYFKKLFKTVKKKSVAFFTSAFRVSGLEDFFDSLNLNTYKDSLYLFIGVSMIRETVSSIPLELYRIVNKDGDTEEVKDNPILDLLNRPNNRQTKKEFWKLSIAYYLLAGEAFWYLERNETTGIPTAKVNMRPDFVEILFNADKSEIIGYKFQQANGQVLNIPAENVLHIKNIDPTNPARGVGVVRPASQRILTEKEASNYQASTFRSQGRPDVAVFLDQDLSEEEASDARKKWDKIYGGADGAKAGFFGNQVKDLKLLNVSPKEMDFTLSLNFLRDDILASLRIPKAMITSDDVNLANSKTARINYLKEACEPVLDAFIDIINNKLLTDIDSDLFVTYESEVQEDRELLLKEATELKQASIITVNEARALLNYPDIDGGDIREQPGSLFQLSMKRKSLKKISNKILKCRPTVYRKLVAIDALANLIVAEKNVARHRNPVFNTKEMREAYIKAYNNNIDQRSSLFKDTVDVYNNQFLNRILKQIEEVGLTTTHFMDASTEMREAMNIFVPLMKNMFNKAGQDTLDAVANGFAQKASEHFYTAEDIIRALELRAEFFIGSMLNTDYDQLKQIITQGMNDGLGIDAIGRNLRKYFDDMSVSRARTIARTETGRLMSFATNEAYKQSAVVTGKEWLTAKDAKVRNGENPNNHEINDGKVVGTNDTFPNGERYPGELTINCRCAIAPAV